jgi:hypothetical protein
MTDGHSERTAELLAMVRDCAWRLVPKAKGRDDVPYSLVTLCLHQGLPEAEFRILERSESPSMDGERVIIGRDVRQEYLPPPDARYWAWESPGELADIVRVEYVGEGLHMTLLQTMDQSLLLVSASDLSVFRQSPAERKELLRDAIQRLMTQDPGFTLPEQVDEGTTVGTDRYRSDLLKLGADNPWGGWSDPSYHVALVPSALCLRFPKIGGYGMVPFRYGQRADRWISPRIGPGHRGGQRN